MRGKNPRMAQRWREGPSERLRALVEASGLSGAALGRYLGSLGLPIKSRYAVRAWTDPRGVSVPNADALAAVLELVGGSADEVLGLRGGLASREARAAQTRAQLEHAEVAHRLAQQALRQAKRARRG